MRLKRFYNIATIKLVAEKSANTFGDLPDCWQCMNPNSKTVDGWDFALLYSIDVVATLPHDSLVFIMGIFLPGKTIFKQAENGAVLFAYVVACIPGVM